MPEQIDDILMGLRDHVEMPPAFLTDRLLLSIDGEAKQSNAFYLQLSALKAYAIEVPSSQLATIKQRIFGAATAAMPSASAGLLVKMIRFSVAAAAVILLFTIGWLVYHKNESPIVEKGIANTNKAAVPPTIPQKDSPYLKKDPATLVKAGRNDAKEFYGKVPFKNFSYSDKIMPVGKNIVMLENNDILYTIITCNYKMLAPYLKANAPEMVVNIDQYSAVTINRKMIEFMKVMYKTRRNDKPTAKAKRAKANLEKWRKKDESNFNDPSKTALDIIDLGEFVLEKN